MPEIFSINFNKFKVEDGTQKNTEKQKVTAVTPVCPQKDVKT